MEIHFNDPLANIFIELEMNEYFNRPFQEEAEPDTDIFESERMDWMQREQEYEARYA